MRRAIVAGPLRLVPKACVAAAVLLTATPAVRAQETPSASPASLPAPVPGQPFTAWQQYDYTVRGDGLVDVVYRIEHHIGVQNIVQQLGEQRLSVNEHFLDLEILEAATLKADGRRINVAPDRIIEQTGNPGQQAVFQADVKLKTVIFPDLAAGDRTLIVTRYKQKREQTPGGFARTLLFPASSRIAGARVTLDAPATLKLAVATRSLEHRQELAGDRVRHTWVYSGQPYRPEEPGTVSANDRAPLLTFSSYPDWIAVGRSFWERAAPKSEPTPEIAALAQKLTAGLTDKREKARAIFEWVTTNIRYVAVYLGAGGLVPHEAARVLESRYGDCKDHTTLMRAMLEVAGIEAEYALINTRPVYKPHEVPALVFDHVILYLPELGLYADPTAHSTSLGVLPAGLYDKPVLRAGAKGVTVARTPTMKPADSRTVVKARLTVAPDGTVTGTAETEGRGVIAASLRSTMAQMEQQDPTEFGKRNLTKQGYAGTATIERRSPTDRSEPYAIRAQFQITDPVLSHTSTRMIPLGPRLIGRPVELMRAVVRDGRSDDFVCYAHSYREEITLRLPEGRIPRVLPRDSTLRHQLAVYSATYKRQGRDIEIVREYTLNVPGSVCKVEVARQLASLLDAADLDFRRVVRMTEPLPGSGSRAQ